MTPQEHSSPPFIVIDGVHNFRMIGEPFIKIKPNIIFRSGDPIYIKETGRKELARLGIKTIIDLRLERPDVEHKIDGTQWLFVSSEEQQMRQEVQLIESWMQQLELAEQKMELWVQEAELQVDKENEGEGELLEKLKQQEIELEKQLIELEKQLGEEQSKPEQWGGQAFPPKLNLDNFQADAKKEFIKTYTEALRENKSAFELFFTHIKNNPGEPVLVHCSAGKDRTGLAIALLLMTLGVDDKEIAHDYALSSIGIKPISETMKDQLKARFEATGRGYNPEGMENFLDVKDDIMRAVLAAVRDVFGGINEYLKTYLYLTDEDIEKIRGSLAVN